MDRKRVLLPEDITDCGKSFLRQKGYEVIRGTGSSVEIIKKEIKDCDAILIRTQNLPGEVLRAGNKLKVISRHGVGVDNIDLKTAKELGIAVTYAPESNANSVAEHTIALMLALTKRLIPLDREVRNNHFALRDVIRGEELENKTISVIGLGKIGRLVAEKSRMGFGMKVIGFDPFLSTEKTPVGVIMTDDLNYAIQNADVLSVHVPNTAENKEFMNASVFKMMRPSAYFINVSRGELVNEEDLAEALKDGVIKGAAIDVFAQEPPSKDNVLLTLDNIVVTPHSAALTTEAMDRMGLHAAMGIDDVLSGRTPKWQVL